MSEQRLLELLHIIVKQTANMHNDVGSSIHSVITTFIAKPKLSDLYILALRPFTGTEFNELAYSVYCKQGILNTEIPKILLRESPVLTRLYKSDQVVFWASSDSILLSALQKAGKGHVPKELLAYNIRYKDMSYGFIILEKSHGDKIADTEISTLKYVLYLLIERHFFLYREKNTLQQILSEMAWELGEVLSNEGRHKADVLQKVLDLSLSVLEAEKCALFLRDAGNSLVLEKVAGELNFQKLKDVATYNLNNYDPSKNPIGVTPWVWYRKKPFNAKSFQELIEHSEGQWKGNWDDPMYGGHAQAQNKFKCVYMAPLIAKNNCIGVLKFENRTTTKKQYFDQEDERLIDIIAEIIAILVTSQRLEKSRYDYALPIISRTLIESFGQPLFYDKLLDECRNLLSADICSLFVLDNKENLNLKSIVGVGEETKRLLSDFSYGNYHSAAGLTPWVLRSGRTFNVRSFPDLKVRSEGHHVGKWDPYVYHDRPEIEFHSLYSVPLKIGEEPIGVFKIENKSIEPFYFTESDERLFDLIGHIIGVGIKYQKMQELGNVHRAAELGFLTSGIAHEFNHYLSHILSRSELAFKKSTNDDTKKYLKDIIEEVNKANEMIKCIKEVKRRQEGSESCDVAELMKQILLFCHERFKYHSINLEYENKGVEVINIDSSRIQTIIINLLSNALDAAIEKGGRGRVSVVIAPLYGERVLIEVADSGRGVPRNKLPYIFTPFFSTKKTGMGIGLYHVSRIVDDLRGEIRVNSPNELGGMTFSIVIPHGSS